MTLVLENRTHSDLIKQRRMSWGVYIELELLGRLKKQTPGWVSRNYIELVGQVSCCLCHYQVASAKMGNHWVHSSVSPLAGSGAGKCSVLVPILGKRNFTWWWALKYGENVLKTWVTTVGRPPKGQSYVMWTPLDVGQKIGVQPWPDHLAATRLWANLEPECYLFLKSHRISSVDKSLRPVLNKSTGKMYMGQQLEWDAVNTDI